MNAPAHTCEWGREPNGREVCGAPAVYRTRPPAMYGPIRVNMRWRYSCEACATALESLGRIGLAVKLT